MSKTSLRGRRTKQSHEKNQLETHLMNTTTISKVLKDTKRVLKHHNELTVAKGEHFNLFSVLKIETRENNTHSAFLAELLNPKGSHRMEDVFLKHFIKTIEHKKDFETKKAKVKVECSIGPIDLKRKKGEDITDASGGRIDIYLMDVHGNVISIENKIHALDQEAQIQRYCNHHKDKNSVYYLTLKGDEPNEKSKLGLESGKDFFTISYRDDITAWLELCLREVPNFTVLRESINQYILLIKKLTNTLGMKEEQDLQDIMLSNLEEAKYIASNYDKMVARLKGRFRKDVMAMLKEELDKELFSIEVGKSVTNKYSQIWIKLKKLESQEFMFGIESFSGAGHKDGDMFVGLLDRQNSVFLEEIKDENKISPLWKQTRLLKTEDENNINLSHLYTLKILAYPDKTEYKNLVTLVVKETIRFINDYQNKLPSPLFKKITLNDLDV